jgi:peptidoglycan hydrolase-like protein with peptidoglycan-binding domain
LQETSSEEVRRLADLTNRKRELQLRHYLDQHDIDQVRIKGIGNARKITLKSYGIETAADVDYNRILAISGFGPVIANSLVDWQQKVKLGFRFDPNLAIDPLDIATIKASIAAKRSDLEAKARQTVNKLQKAVADASAIRANPGSQAADAWTGWSNAQEFERELRPSAQEVVKLAAVGTVSAVSLFSFSNLMVSISPYLIERQKQLDVTMSTHLHEAEPTSSGGGLITPQPGSRTSSQTAPSIPADQPAQPTRPSEAPPPPPAEGTDGAKPLLGVSSGIVPVAPPKESTLAPGTVAGPLHNPLNRPDAFWLQDRLRELGYYSGNRDGVWGLNSKAALRAFKTQNGLPADDKWDAAAESKLLGLAQAGVDQTFEGGWAQHVGDCGIGSASAPVKISRKGAEAKSGNCEFQDVRREGMGWQVRGFCNAGGKSWEANIHLSLVGGVLTWSSERGTVAYFRCR